MLIDEARVPLIISGKTDASVAQYATDPIVVAERPSAHAHLNSHRRRAAGAEGTLIGSNRPAARVL